MKTVVVGISGGVDSSVAAYLLKKQGYNVIGLFMINWEEGENCTAEQDYEDVKRVCNTLQIPYFSVNFAKEYYDNVFEYFLEQYKNGRTPNPDVLCNREIKFKPFLQKAKALGADFIATGHYVKKVQLPDGKNALAKADDLSKDQSYFLNQLSEAQIKDALFPLENLQKTQVRQIAEELGLVNAKKKDSTGICFIGERNFKKFLSQYLPAQPGLIKTVDGKVVGKHDGLMYYTLGQRRGLGIGGKSDGNGERWFVLKKDLKENVLVVSQGEGEELFSVGLDTKGFNWLPNKPQNDGFDCFAKFRYRQPDQKVKVTFCDQNVHLDFYEKQRAVTEGQYAVLYDQNGVMLGGGEIDKVYF